MPTMLALTATPAPAGLDGRNLAGRAPRDRTIYVDTFTRSLQDTYKIDLNAAIDRRHKMTFDRTDGTLRLQVRGARDRPGTNLLPDQPSPALERAQIRYLEECGGPPRIVE